MNKFVSIAIVFTAGFSLGAAFQCLNPLGVGLGVDSLVSSHVRAQEDKVQSLQQQIDTLLEERRELSDTLASASSLANGLTDSADASASDRAVNSRSIAAVLLGESNQQRPARSFPKPNYDAAMQRLAEAGFSAFDAEVIYQIESTAQNQVVELFADPQANNRRMAMDVVRDTSAKLHRELGDYGYENYLKANGQAAAVNVGSVVKDSNGALAGLKPGDKILRYDGIRVFDIYELNRATSAGLVGQTVAVEVSRNGQIQQLLVPRGTIGIMSRPRIPRELFNME